MRATVLNFAADLICDYIDGRWDRLDRLHQQQPLIAISGGRPSLLALLTCLSPLRVLTNTWDMNTAEQEGLVSSQLLRIRTCRGHLLQALAALSLGDSPKAHASTTAFCASLSTLVADVDPVLASASVVLKLAGPSRLHQTLQLFQCGRLHQLAADLPARMTIVLGMHRSGTSALSGMLQAAGLEAPRDVLGASVGNPMGYWESRRLVGLTDHFLNRLGCSWSQLFRAPCGWVQNDITLEWVADYLNAMAQCFGTGQHIVLKDPRLCLVLSPLCSAWYGGGMTVDYLLILRSPVEVVASLTAIHPIRALDALCLWIASVLNSERETRHLPRRFIGFPELLAAPQDVLTRCRSMWGFSTDATNDDPALSMIDVSLHRQKTLQARERILADSPQLEHLLNFADLVYDAVMNADELNGSEQLDGLNQVWDWKLAELMHLTDA